MEAIAEGDSVNEEKQKSRFFLSPAWGRFMKAGVMPRLTIILLGVPCFYLITLRGGLFFLVDGDEDLVDPGRRRRRSCFGLMAVGLAACAARRQSGLAAGWITAAVLLTTPIFLLASSWALLADCPRRPSPAGRGCGGPLG